MDTTGDDQLQNGRGYPRPHSVAIMNGRFHVLRMVSFDPILKYGIHLANTIWRPACTTAKVDRKQYGGNNDTSMDRRHSGIRRGMRGGRGRADGR